MGAITFPDLVDDRADVLASHGLDGMKLALVALPAGPEPTYADIDLRFFNGLHVAAILYYRFKGKKLVSPMITGKGEVEPGIQPMRPGKGWVAILCLIVAIGITRWIIAGAPPFR